MKFSFSKQKVKKFLLVHIFAFLGILFYSYVFGCPLQRLFGITCPGCGMSRAWIAFFKLDFKSAFSFHPLFIPITCVLLYALHREVLPKKLPQKAETVLFILVGPAAVILWIYRLFSDDPVVKIDFEESIINKYFIRRFFG